GVRGAARGVRHDDLDGFGRPRIGCHCRMTGSQASDGNRHHTRRARGLKLDTQLRLLGSVLRGADGGPLRPNASAGGLSATKTGVAGILPAFAGATRMEMCDSRTSGPREHAARARTQVVATAHAIAAVRESR